MADSKAERILGRLSKKKDERKNLDAYNDDIARLIYPERIGFQTEITKGDSRTDDIFDSTPAQARWQLATSTQGYVTPKGGEEWMKVEIDDEALMDDHAVRAWCDMATNITFNAMYEPGAQFGKAAGSAFNDVVSFGYGGFGMFERFSEYGVSPAFVSIHPKSIYWQNNEYGETDTYWVEYERPLINAARMYGAENLSHDLQKKLRDEKYDMPVKLLHYVTPRENRDYRRQDNKAMPLESCVLEADGKHLVEESGFPECPYALPTWGEAGADPWSPARLLLPDVKMLNQQQRTTLEVAHFSARPAHLIPHEGVIDFSALQPGAWLTYDAQTAALNGGRPPIFPFVSGANYPITREITQETRDRVWQGFLRTILNLPVDGPQMTATEVIERKEEMMRTVGPIYDNLESTFSQKVVRRVFFILYRGGAIPAPPEVLTNRPAPLKFSVNSPFSAVRKQIEAAASVRAFELLGPWIETRPHILDNFDEDEIARNVGEALMPVNTLRPVQEVQAMREQRAQQEKQMAQQQETYAMAEMAGKAAPMVKALEGEAA